MLSFKTLCLIQAPIESLSGYGQHSRDIVKSLMKIRPDWEYSIVATRWGDTPMNSALDESIKSKINKLIKNKLIGITIFLIFPLVKTSKTNGPIPIPRVKVKRSKVATE